MPFVFHRSSISLARGSVSLPVLAAALLAGFSMPAFAQEDAIDLGTVKVEDVSKYKANQASSPKYTAPLLNTPQTVTVVNKEVIAEQNLLNLRDILATTVPGITFGAGEGGGGYGDNINLRGYTASSDITLDGVRDSAQYTRSDPFNVERIEVANGASSVYAGSGSVGGTINMVSKTPTGNDFTILSLGAGSDSYGRATVDAERLLDDHIALRLNAMAHYNDVPGRDVEKFERWGFAPSLKIGVDMPTSFTLSYFYQHDLNVPQYGLPYFTNAFNTETIAGINREAFFGYSNLDRQKNNVHVVTGVLDHKFSDVLQLRNLTRYAHVSQGLVSSAVQGTWCDANGRNPATGAVCAPVGTYNPSGPRGNVRNSVNTVVFNQTDVTWNFATGEIAHTLVVGAAFTHETFDLRNGNVARNTNGSQAVLPVINIANPNNVYAGPLNYIPGGGSVPNTLPATAFPSGITEGTRNNQAVYAFDRLQFGRQFELNIGIRYEHNEGDNLSTHYTYFGYLPSGSQLPGPILAGAPGGVLSGPGPRFTSDESLVSYRIGGIYKPEENISLYVAYGNSKTPSQSAVNSACAVDTCGVGAETAVNYEVGAKWDLFEGSLSLTAAWFRNERSNYKVASNDPTQPDQQLDGAAYVQGVALGVAGAITPDWAVFANYTYLESEVTQAVSDFCLANPLVAACATALAGTANNQPIAGNPLTNTPEHALNIWTTYQLPYDFQIGLGITYQGRFNLNNGAAPLFKSQDYVVTRLMVGYEVNDNLNLQLNVNNLFDEFYFTRIRNNGWATPGDGRQVTVTASYRL